MIQGTPQRADHGVADREWPLDRRARRGPRQPSRRCAIIATVTATQIDGVMRTPNRFIVTVAFTHAHQAAARNAKNDHCVQPRRVTMHGVGDLADVRDHHQVEEQLEPVHPSTRPVRRVGTAGLCGGDQRLGATSPLPRARHQAPKYWFPSALLFRASNSPWLMTSRHPAAAFACAMSSAGVDGRGRPVVVRLGHRAPPCAAWHARPCPCRRAITYTSAVRNGTKTRTMIQTAFSQPLSLSSRNRSLMIRMTT